MQAPLAMRDYAVAATLGGHSAIALSTYRQLVTLVTLWPSAVDRRRLYIEAAAAALAQGSQGAAEASGYLAEARQGAFSVRLRAIVAGLEALAQRMGGAAGADGLSPIDSAEAWRLIDRLRQSQRPDSWPAMGPIAHAAAAIAIEPFSAAEAAELWQTYLTWLEANQPDTKWLEQARQHLTALTRESQ
jgi:hypothetical protein